MHFVTGIQIPLLLEALPALGATATLGVSGEGIVLVLQAVAYVLVSLAAVAVLLRFGLRGGRQAGGTYGNRNDPARADTPFGRVHEKAHGRFEHSYAERNHEGYNPAEHSPAEHSPAECCHNGQSHRAAGAAEAHDRTIDADETHRRAAGGDGAHDTPMSHRLRFDSATGQAGGSDAASSAEPRSLTCGRLPDHCELPPPFNARAADSGQQPISPPAGDAATTGAEAADERRRITAVIAAAVHNALGGQRHRIVRIEPVGHGWAQEGRRDIFSSHRIR